MTPRLLVLVAKEILRKARNIRIKEIVKAVDWRARLPIILFFAALIGVFAYVAKPRNDGTVLGNYSMRPLSWPKGVPPNEIMAGPRTPARPTDNPAQ